MQKNVNGSMQLVLGNYNGNNIMEYKKGNNNVISFTDGLKK